MNSILILSQFYELVCDEIFSIFAKKVEISISNVGDFDRETG